MDNEEQRVAESVRPTIDPRLVGEVITQTQNVNHNLGVIMNRADTVIRRQNLLTVLFILSLALNALHLGLGFSMQQLQQAAKAQLTAMDSGRLDLLGAANEAKTQVAHVRSEIQVVRESLQAAPIVTADSKGRINLEVPLNPAAQKTVFDQPQVSGDTRAPEKLVIPIRPSQSRLAN